MCSVCPGENLISVDLEENHAAIKNPLKGWRGQINQYYWGSPPVDDNGIPYSQPIWDTCSSKNLESIRKWYAHWDELESGDPAAHNDEERALERIRVVTEKYLGCMPLRNMKAIPRLEVFTKDGPKVPRDLPPISKYTDEDGTFKNGDRDHPWWELPEVRFRVGRLIRRLGLVWDNDPRVAAVQFGTFGKYGEMWGLAAQKKFGTVEEFLHNSYQTAFVNKHIMIRMSPRAGNPGPYRHSNSPRLAEIAPYGAYLDSFAFQGNELTKINREPEMTAFLKLNHGQRWKNAPLGGEAPIKRQTRNPRRATAGIFDDEKYREYMLWCIRYSHMTWLGSPEGEQLKGGSVKTISDFHKILGYRFVLSKAWHNVALTPTSGLKIGFSVRNDGSAPFLYKWPLVVSLADPATKNVVWSGEMTSVDIRKWLPGDECDRKTGEYKSPPKIYNEEFTLTIGTEKSCFPGGKYVLCLSIADPDGGMLNCVRFANENYWQGTGLHPIGKIFWNVPVEAEDYRIAQLDAKEFFLDGVDDALSYSA